MGAEGGAGDAALYCNEVLKPGGLLRRGTPDALWEKVNPNFFLNTTMLFKHFHFMRLTAAGVLALVLPGACTAYRPQPVDLARDSVEWQQVSQRVCPPGHALSKQELHSLGLLLNPDLNRARLTHARSTAVAEFAGLWQDPSLSAEAQRVLTDNFYNKSVGFSITLPVTGLPGLAKKVAEQYKEADYWEVKAQERDFLCRVDTLRNVIMITHARHHVMQQRIKVMKEEMAQIEKLHHSGEISFSEYQVACQRMIDTRKEELEMDKTHLEKHLEMVSLVGLHPSCRNFELAGGLPSGIPGSVPAPSADALLASPSLKAQLAGYGATEQELRMEIRRQYPEISLTPTLGSEDSNRQLGLGFSMDIPLWNRNREAIAKSGHDRALKQAEVIALWRSLQQQSAALGDRQHQAIRHCRTEYEGLQKLEEAAKREEELFRAGESTLPQLAEARHEVYQRRLSFLECLGDLLDVQTALFYLNPNNN